MASSLTRSHSSRRTAVQHAPTHLIAFRALQILSRTCAYWRFVLRKIATAPIAQMIALSGIPLRVLVTLHLQAFYQGIVRRAASKVGTASVLLPFDIFVLLLNSPWICWAPRSLFVGASIPCRSNTLETWAIDGVMELFIHTHLSIACALRPLVMPRNRVYESRLVIHWMRCITPHGHSPILLVMASWRNWGYFEL